MHSVVNGNGNGTPIDSTTPSGALTPTTAFDVSIMRAFLISLLPAVMGATREQLEDTIFDSEFEERVTRFANEGGGPLYVVKVKEESEGKHRI